MRQGHSFIGGNSFLPELALAVELLAKLGIDENGCFKTNKNKKHARWNLNYGDVWQI
jgi:hypothetical protein